MDTHAYVVYSIATLSLVFGLIALLRQKDYIDSETALPVEVEVPLLGNLKTNYPALIFVVLGIMLANHTFGKVAEGRLVPDDASKQESEWLIRGQFRVPEGREVSWQEGTFSPFPSGFKPMIYSDGTFEIEIMVADGKPLEEALQSLYFNHPDVSVSISLEKEHLGFVREGESIIKEKTETSWTFKPIIVEPFVE